MSLYYVLEHSLLLCVLYAKSCWRTGLLENEDTIVGVGLDIHRQY